MLTLQVQQRMLRRLLSHSTILIRLPGHLSMEYLEEIVKSKKKRYMLNMMQVYINNKLASNIHLLS